MGAFIRGIFVLISAAFWFMVILGGLAFIGALVSSVIGPLFIGGIFFIGIPYCIGKLVS